MIHYNTTSKVCGSSKMFNLIAPAFLLLKEQQIFTPFTQQCSIAFDERVIQYPPF